LWKKPTRISSSNPKMPMSKINPYESPKAPCVVANASISSDVTKRAHKTLREALWLLGFGGIVGAILGLLACGVLSAGNAAGQIYVACGCSGGVVGVAGSIMAGLIIALMRLAERLTGRFATRAGHRTIAFDESRNDDAMKPVNIHSP
jgi:hypothetical protein